jgi:hypothetical protein
MGRLVAPRPFQINLTIPAALADGDHAVSASVAGSSSQSGALVKIAAAAKLTARNTTRRGFLSAGKTRLPLYDKAGIEHVAWFAGLRAGLVNPVSRPQSTSAA